MKLTRLITESTVRTRFGTYKITDPSLLKYMDLVLNVTRYPKLEPTTAYGIYFLILPVSSLRKQDLKSLASCMSDRQSIVTSIGTMKDVIAIRTEIKYNPEMFVKM